MKANDLSTETKKELMLRANLMMDKEQYEEYSTT